MSSKTSTLHVCPHVSSHQGSRSTNHFLCKLQKKYRQTVPQQLTAGPSGSSGNYRSLKIQMEHSAKCHHHQSGEMESILKIEGMFPEGLCYNWCLPKSQMRGYQESWSSCLSSGFITWVSGPGTSLPSHPQPLCRGY